jgi:hypothetical protein
MPSQDYEEFIAALNEHNVRYLLVGAHAVAYHARPRATKDLDIFLEPTAENAARTLAALRAFFGADVGYSPEEIVDPTSIIQLGVAPVRIDIISRLLGCADFNAAWENRIEGRFGSVPAFYLSLDDLIVAKQAAGRPQDRADLRALRRVQESKQRTRRRKTPRR